MEKSKEVFVLTVLFFIISMLFSVSAVCGSGQIDINSATLEELDTLSGIGPVYAQGIIDSRPFSSVEDLIDVKGIGNVTLAKIKTQGLACVEDEENVREDVTQEEVNVTETKFVNIVDNTPSLSPVPEAKKTIILNPQVIKTDEPKNLKKDAAVWGFAIFCVLITVLFIIRGKKYKNEFR